MREKENFSSSESEFVSESNTVKTERCNQRRCVGIVFQTQAQSQSEFSFFFFLFFFKLIFKVEGTLSKFQILRWLSKDEKLVVASDLYNRMLKRETNDLNRLSQLVQLLTAQNKLSCIWKTMAKLREKQNKNFQLCFLIFCVVISEKNYKNVV
jgi:hypothetical protein